MSSTFGTINVGLSGLQAHRSALDIAGQNIANVNTPGYHRRRADLQTAAAPFGEGAVVALVRRVEDGFLLPQTLGTRAEIGRQEARLSTLRQVQTALGEPSDTGLSAQLDKLFAAFQELSAHPESDGARAQVLHLGQAVASRFRTTYGAVEALQDDLDGRVASALRSFNGLAEQVARLNRRIASSPEPPLDLLDQRQQLLREMSAYAPISVLEGGGVVTLAGRVVVQGGEATEVRLAQAAAPPAAADAFGDSDFVEISSADFAAGEIAGLLSLRSEAVPEVLRQLDALASALAGALNAAHQEGSGLDGTTGLPFYTGDGARNLQVNAELVDHPERLAASGTGAPGDGSAALRMAQVRSQAVLGSRSVGQAFAGLVAASGAAVQTADTSLEQARLELEQLDNEAASLTGVSLDEEAAAILQSQQAYNASAKLITVSDEMIASLLNMVGR